MSRKNQKQSRSESERLTLSDALDDSMIAQLREAKKELTIVEKEKEQERQQQLRLERKRREENKSFEQLLEEYGDIGSKY